MNNNKSDEAALLAGCKGVFSKTSYISMGQKDKPEEFVKKLPPRSVYAGKQLAISPAKEGKTNDTYFEKKHNWIADGDKYVDKLRYKDTQSDKKKGFLTSDFTKRDEFTNTIRTEQWREQLTQEDKFAKKSLEMFSSTAGVLTTTAAYDAYEEGPEVFLYDLVFEKEDPGFSGASKIHRDSKNRTYHTRDRNLGGRMTTQTLAFQPPEDHTKPDYARRPLIRDTFYRKTNIFYPQGCSADPSS